MLFTIFEYNLRLEGPLDRSVFRGVKSQRGHDKSGSGISLQIKRSSL
jgi:hypothetical protein